MKRLGRTLAMLGATLLVGSIAWAQAGDPPKGGSPKASTPTAVQSGAILPRPEPAFKGKIGRTYKESTPDFPRGLPAPERALYVLLILTDDTGFGHAATFGGAAATPTLDRLAASGLRYN